MKKYSVLIACCVLVGCHQNENSTMGKSVNDETSQVLVSVQNSSQSNDGSGQMDLKETTIPSNHKEQNNDTSTEVSTTEQPYFSIKGKYDDIIIVNKKHPLSSEYNPGEQLQAKQAFLLLKTEMKSQGFPISDQYSGFRSYETQANLYQNYVNRDGQVQADTYSARAGYSEHQTGLAFDLLELDGQLLTEPNATAWLFEHAHEYGFIVRYLPNKEYITGYMAEPWHIRYIGQEARDIYYSGLTLEEYFDIEGGDYR